MSTMLYKHPGPHKIHRDKFNYVIVDEDDIEVHLEKGWFRTTPEAKANSSDGSKSEKPKVKKVEKTKTKEPEESSDVSQPQSQEPVKVDEKKDNTSDEKPSRDQVKAKADKLGIDYYVRIPTDKLQKLVEDKLDELDKA